MDEPTSSLHRNDVRNLFKLIRSLLSDGISIIYISHFLEEVREIADSFTVLRDGRSVAAGTIADVTDEFLVAQMVGRSIDHLYPERAVSPPESEIVMEVNDLSAPPAVQHASFQLKRGDILGIAGLVGAGRSEMVRAIFGLDPAQSGTIAFRGRSVVARGGKPAVRLLQGLGYLSEDRKNEGLALSLSISDNMTMTGFSECSRWGWLHLDEQRSGTKRLVDRLGVRARNVDQTVRTLSGGNQQKVALARLMYQNAEVLLLDEPTRGIDIGSRARVYEIIGELAGSGKAILLISSYLPELFGMCNRLAVMSRGRLTPSRPIEDWTPETVMQEAIGESEQNVRIDGH
jgi:ribose transport system ATP-binding protein